MEVEEKIEQMQKFIPCIHLLIENLQKDPEKDGQVKKMEYLLDMLTKKDNSIKMDTLLKCESILVKIYGREKQFVSLMEGEKPKLGKDDNDQIGEPQSEEEQKGETETALKETSKVEKPEIGAEIEAEVVKPRKEQAPKIEVDSETAVDKSSKEEEQKEVTEKSPCSQRNNEESSAVQEESHAEIDEVDNSIVMAIKLSAEDEIKFDDKSSAVQEEFHGENDDVDNSIVQAIKLAAEAETKFDDGSKHDAAAETTVENSLNDSKEMEEAKVAEIKNEEDIKNPPETVTETVENIDKSTENTGVTKIENICGTENVEDVIDDEICATELNNSQAAEKKTGTIVVDDSEDDKAGVNKSSVVKENCNEKADDSDAKAKASALEKRRKNAERMRERRKREAVTNIKLPDFAAQKASALEKRRRNAERMRESRKRKAEAHANAKLPGSLVQKASALEKRRKNAERMRESRRRAAEAIANTQLPDSTAQKASALEKRLKEAERKRESRKQIATVVINTKLPAFTAQEDNCGPDGLKQKRAEYMREYRKRKRETMENENTSKTTQILAPRENGIQADDTTCDMEIDEELTNVSSQTCPEMETPKTSQNSNLKQLLTASDSTKEKTQLSTNKEPQNSSNIVDLTSDDDEPSTKKAATPKTNSTPSNITTIDLLDSDSDDEGGRKGTKKSSPAQLKMPTPKIVTQPMFTISSVQSINDNKMQADAVQKQLVELVKAVQYSSYHTVPYKYNTAVRVYLEKFIRDLMFEKNRVNLCLQKLQKAVDFEKYKGFKKIIQSYCSEPVNDPNLPAPSPLCHRIKVYPEKLQWVMRRTFFSENKITVIGYKVYSLEHTHSNTNGVRRVVTTPTKTLPTKPVQPSKTVQPGKTMQGSATKTMQPAKSRFPDKSFTNLSNFSDPLLIPSRIVDATDVISNDSNSNTGSDILSPTRSDSKGRRRSSSNKNRRRKRTDDDDDDDNYVPHDLVEVPAESRRVSLQRASKARCQRYLQSTVENGKVDDIVFDKALESSESEEEHRPKSPPPPPPPPRQNPPKKVRKRITPKRKVPEEVSETEKVSEPVIEPQVAEPAVAEPALKRTRGQQSRATETVDGEEDDEGELPPDKNTLAKWKNTWSGFHCHSKFMDRCLICHERTKENLLIPHYVNQHRNRDVFISRLTKSDVMKILSETMNFAFPAATKSSIATFVAYCFFCRAENCLSVRSWFEHYTRHTGEYAFECSNCAMRKSRLAHCKKHVKSECTSQKKNSEVIVLFELEAEATKIDAYICRLCNYVQLRLDNLVRHLQSEHEVVGDISEEHFCTANLFDTAQPFYGDPYGGVGSEYGNVEDMSASFTGAFGQDDMSFMICNKLANPEDAQTATDSELVPKNSQEENSTESTAAKETNSTEANSSAKDDNVKSIQFLPSHGDETNSNLVTDASTSAAIVESTDEKMETDIENLLESSQIPTTNPVVESSTTDNPETTSSLAESAQPVDDVIFEITEMEVDIHNL